MWPFPLTYRYSTMVTRYCGAVLQPYERLVLDEVHLIVYDNNSLEEGNKRVGGGPLSSPTPSTVSVEISNRQ